MENIVPLRPLPPGDGTSEAAKTASRTDAVADPKGKTPKEKPAYWKGKRIGYWRGPYIWFRKKVHGKKIRKSSECKTEKNAWAEYQRFEADPVHYLPSNKGAVAVGTEWTQAVLAFLDDQRTHSDLSDSYLDEMAAQLGRFGEHPGFHSLDSFTTGDVKAFLKKLKDGELTFRLVAKTVKRKTRVGTVVEEPVWDLDQNGKVKRDEKGRRMSVKVKKPIKTKRTVTRNRHLAALKSLMSWARDQDPPLTKNDADTKVKLSREQRDTRPPESVEEPRWRAVEAKLTARYAATQTTLLGSGMRYSEIARLKNANDVKDHGIIVRTAKGKKGRTIPVSGACVAAARRLIELGGAPNDRGKSFNEAVEAAATQGGVKKYTAHHMRHTFATTSLRNGIGLRDLQKRMGHASIKTTEKYLHALEIEDGGGKDYAPV